MKKVGILAAMFAVSVTLPVLAGGKDCLCGSKTAKTVNWCAPCKGGVVYTHKTKSKKIVKVLAGHEMVASRLNCDQCRHALKTNGQCCGKTYTNGMAFKSTVGAALSQGMLVESGKISCAGCKTGFEKSEFCTGCNAGFVGGLKFKSKDSYDKAKQAHTVLAKAVASKCEACGVAMLTDKSCKKCNVSFKNGEKVSG